MTEHVDCVVIGAGVVGLAVARALAMRGREVVILEAESAIGTGISSRNSEVIHAGIYYPPGSLKARLCRQGNAQLYDYCESRSVPHRRIGKLIVASDAAQIDALERIRANAIACGVTELETLSAAQVRRREPALVCAAALWSPDTGIVDSHALMLALLGDAEAAGAVLAVQSPVCGGAVEADGILINGGSRDGVEGSASNTASYALKARLLVNCAGLAAPRVAESIVGMPRSAIPAQRLAKGSYFGLSGRAPFSHLIYPVPEPGGLGVHVTLDLGGQVKFGPDVEWLAPGAVPDYRVDAERAERFAAAIRKYWPGLPEQALVPAYAGVRPKLGGPHDPPCDFVIAGPADHGIAGLIHLFGIESPGLTSALAIAEHVAAMTPHEGAAERAYVTERAT